MQKQNNKKLIKLPTFSVDNRLLKQCRGWISRHMRNPMKFCNENKVTFLFYQHQSWIHYWLADVTASVNDRPCLKIIFVFMTLFKYKSFNIFCVPYKQISTIFVYNVWCYCNYSNWVQYFHILYASLLLTNQH